MPQLERVEQVDPLRDATAQRSVQITSIAAEAALLSNPSPTRTARRYGVNKSTASRWATTGRNPLREALEFAATSERPFHQAIAMQTVARMAAMEGLSRKDLESRIREAVDCIKDDQSEFDQLVREGELEKTAQVSKRLAALHVEIAAAVHELNTRRVH